MNPSIYFGIIAKQMLETEEKYVSFGWNYTLDDLYRCIYDFRRDHKDYRIITEKIYYGCPPTHEFFMQMIPKTEEDIERDKGLGASKLPLITHNMLKH